MRTVADTPGLKTRFQINIQTNIAKRRYEIPTDDETEFKLRWEEIKNDNVEHANKRRNCSSKLLQESEDNYPVNHS